MSGTTHVLIKQQSASSEADGSFLMEPADDKLTRGAGGLLLPALQSSRLPSGTLSVQVWQRWQCGQRSQCGHGLGTVAAFVPAE